MTLIFSANDYKYELEGIMKLFIPASLFTHIYSDKIETDDDFVFARERKFNNYTLLYVIASYKGKCLHKSHIIRPSDKGLDADCELIMSRLLYMLMQRLTGKSSGWGVITGIRPVKRVNAMISEGLNKTEISEILKTKYLCSDEKCELSYLTAQIQKKALDELPQNSFSLYISVPFCPTRCSYCSFVSQSVEGTMKLIPEYINKLCEEIRYTGSLVKRLGLRPDTVYFGGGTPTTFTAPQLERIMKTISESFDMSALREYTVEAGRPDTITEEKLRTIKALGCKRISINPQTLNDKVLETIGRKHSTAQFYESYELARKVGFECVNTDIIAGLPSDTVESFKHTIDELIRLSPENITVHTLSIKRSARINQSHDRTVLDNPASEMVSYASKKLLEAGYCPYYLYRQKNMLDNLENIGWTKNAHESLYNIYIMEEVQTILAMGAGASTKLVDIENKRLERVFNYKFPLEYNKHFDLMLKKKDEIEDFYVEKE